MHDPYVYRVWSQVYQKYLCRGPDRRWTPDVSAWPTFPDHRQAWAAAASALVEYGPPLRHTVDPLVWAVLIEVLPLSRVLAPTGLPPVDLDAVPTDLGFPPTVQEADRIARHEDA